MNRNEILTMAPGRELDVLVSECVFGVKPHRVSEQEYSVYTICRDHVFAGGYVVPAGRDGWDELKNYSTDIAAAWEVVEEYKACSPCVNYLRNSPHGEGWHCRIGLGLDKGAHARGCETAPEAICKAALLAVIGEGGEKGA